MLMCSFVLLFTEIVNAIYISKKYISCCHAVHPVGDVLEVYETIFSFRHLWGIFRQAGKGNGHCCTVYKGESIVNKQ